MVQVLQKYKTRLQVAKFKLHMSIWTYSSNAHWNILIEKYLFQL